MGCGGNVFVSSLILIISIIFWTVGLLSRRFAFLAFYPFPLESDYSRAGSTFDIGFSCILGPYKKLSWFM
jgi:hypothetical protein